MDCECGGHQFGSQPAIWSVSVVVISLLPSPAIWTGMRKFWIHQDFLIEHWHMLCIMSMSICLKLSFNIGVPSFGIMLIQAFNK